MPSRKIAGMRNREAARYARWSAGVAVAICVLVLGVYLQRRARERARGKTFAPVPATVAQQSASFGFSRVVGTRTLFTVHASQATQFKDENRSLLENVEITIFGPRGDRNDSVRAGECSYEPDTGSIRCQGAVQIDLRDAKTSAQQSGNAKSSTQKTPAQNASLQERAMKKNTASTTPAQSIAAQQDAAGQNSQQGNGTQKSELHLETSDILFEHDSGKVSTDKPVTLKFSGGEGKGVGLVYEPQSEEATLEKNVQLEITPPKKSGAVPVQVTSSALEFNRSKNLLRLSGPVRVQQEMEKLTSGTLDLQLDAAMQPVRAVATGNPEIAANGARGKVLLAADEMTADLSPDGTIQKISADEIVHGESSGRDGENRLSAQHAQVLMSSSSAGNRPQEILAQGDVKAETSQGAKRGNLATQSLRVELAANERGDGQRITSAETLASGKMEMAEPNETAELEGGKLSAVFDGQSQLSELHGSAGVRVERELGSDPAQTTTAQNLEVRFGSDGNWETIDESGNVRFRQGDKIGEAKTAQLSRATNEMVLAGSASVEDSASHLTATKIEMNQATDEMRASGKVAATFTGQKENAAVGVAGGVQISADEMNGTSPAKSSNANVPTNSSGNLPTNSSKGGHAIFSGHARLWEGSDVLQAQAIEFWQDENRVEARGDALGAFVEAPHDTAANGSPTGAANAKQTGKKSAPVLWQVHAPKVDYWSDSGKMDWSGGVEAQSSEGRMTSQTLEMLFSKDGNNQQTMERAIAAGKVRIQENGRTGTAERGEYVAREGKFILSGGKPTLQDSSGNTTTGRELTFFLANDSILVDSQSDSRSMSKHQDEKY
ncbi:MAG: LptA/OstA family protein [Candidatus Acidiferrales bacterium]